MADDKRTNFLSLFTKALVATCVRNGYLETLHAGIQPASKTGDYSDVKVVTPYGEIPWRDVSKFDDDQMKILIKDIVDSIHTVLLQENDSKYLLEFIRSARPYFADWDEPKINAALLKKP